MIAKKYIDTLKQMSLRRLKALKEEQKKGSEEYLKEIQKEIDSR